MRDSLRFSTQVVAVIESPQDSLRGLVLYDRRSHRVQSRSWLPLFGFRKITLSSMPVASPFAITDLDRDGLSDIACGPATLPGGCSGTVHFALSSWNSFVPSYARVNLALPDQPADFAVADLDRDRNDDLLMTFSRIDRVGILFGGEQAGVEEPFNPLRLAPPRFLETGREPLGLAVKDFNGDLLPDIAVVEWKSNSVSVFPGTGDRGFGPRSQWDTPPTSRGLAAVDASGDGIPDLLVTTLADGRLDLIPGMGDGTFGHAIEYPAGVGENRILHADADGDRIPDLLLAGGSPSGLHLRPGLGARRFGPDSLLMPLGCPGSLMYADLDGDGVKEFLLAHDPSSVAVQFRDPGGLGPLLDYALPSDASSLRALADLDGDGKLDAVGLDESGMQLGIVLNSTALPEIPPGPYRAGISFALSQNPASGMLKLEYQNDDPWSYSNSRIEILDVTGRLVEAFTVPWTGEASGFVIWRGITRTGQVAPSGTYFARMITPRFESQPDITVRRFVWLR